MVSWFLGAADWFWTSPTSGESQWERVTILIETEISVLWTDSGSFACHFFLHFRIRETCSSMRTTEPHMFVSTFIFIRKASNLNPTTFPSSSPTNFHSQLQTIRTISHVPTAQGTGASFARMGETHWGSGGFCPEPGGWFSKLVITVIWFVEHLWNQ